jgi:hypothetical protein
VSTSSLMHHEDGDGPGFSAPHRSDRTIRRATLLVATLLLSTVALSILPGSVPATGQETLTLGIDANTAGNGPLTLGTIDQRVSVCAGDTFDIDIYVQNVEKLLAWEVYMGFDPDVLAVTGRDVKMFLAGNPGSVVLDVSGSAAEAGLYHVAAADTSDPPTPDSGSGVLARLTLEAKASGRSDLELITRDVDNDGRPDLGPLLRNVDAQILGDSNGDGIFDGPIENAEVTVVTDCQGLHPGSNTATSSGNGLSAIAWVGIGLGIAAAVLAASGAGWFTLRRRRARSS